MGVKKWYYLKANLTIQEVAVAAVAAVAVDQEVLGTTLIVEEMLNLKYIYELN